MLKKYTAFFAFILVFQVVSFAQSRFKAGDKVNVVTGSGLNIRSAPDTKAQVVILAPYGSALSVEADSRNPVAFSFDGINGFWLYVNYNGKKGYAFDGFLSRLPAPAANNRWMSDYVDQKLQKVGTAQKGTKPDPNNAGGTIDVLIQKLNNNLILTSSEQENLQEHTLKIPNCSLEEAFVLGRAIDPNFKSMSFPAKWERSPDTEPAEWTANQADPKFPNNAYYWTRYHDANGKIQQYNCTYRHEAGSVWLRVEYEGSFVLLSLGSHAD
jgi:Bacterial SH3 domain